MIFFEKRKIILIITMFILSVIVYNININKNIIDKNQENLVQTVALPVDKKAIIIDAGHGRRRWRSYE